MSWTGPVSDKYETMAIASSPVRAVVTLLSCPLLEPPVI
jgi:hypothetical protein